MKNTLLLLSLIYSFQIFGQENCIDPELIDPDAGCFEIWDPVCGCDNVTYSNSCYAEVYNGVTSWTPGECATGVGECPQLEPGLDFGMCAAVVGVALVNGQCVGISGCSTVASNGTDYAAYFYEDFDECTACAEALGCVDPDQIDVQVLCPGVIDPVCGCDDVTYNNTCEAYYYGGVTSWIPGECGSPEECPELPVELDFGDCDAIIGTALVNGNCVGITGCSTVASDNVDYAAYFYEDAEDCIACTDSVECVNPDQIDPDFLCTEEYDPVCGCDGETYSNDCHAFYYGGVTSWTSGECGDVVPCTDVAGVDFGPCLVIIGYAVLDGQCSGISGCSTTGSDEVDYSEAFFESYEDCQDCFGCINPDQIDEGFACTEEYDPVCGCDSVTYSNDCYAYYYGGVTSWTAGECVNTGIEDVDRVVDVQFIQGQYMRLISDQFIESISLFDLSGKTILEKGQLSPGEHEILLPFDRVGVYLYKIQLKEQVQTGKVFVH